MGPQGGGQGLLTAPDYKTHNAPGCGGGAAVAAVAAGKAGVPSGVCDLATSRPEVPKGPLWSQAVSPCALTVPTPPPPQLAPARPAPGSPSPSRHSGVGVGGGKMGGVIEDQGGEGEVSDSRPRSGVLQQAEFGEASRGGAGSGRLGVGFEGTRRGRVGWGVATLGGSSLLKGAV